MSAEVILPRFNMDMEEGTIVRWLRRDGDQVRDGEPLCEVETDKVAMEVEAPAAGVLCGLRAQEGETVRVTSVIAYIASDEYEAHRIRAESEPSAQSQDGAAPSAQQLVPEQPSPETDGRSVGERVRASPAVRRLAREHGIDLAALADEGGRVTRSAVEEAISRQAGTVAPVTAERAQVATIASARLGGEPLGSTRKAIAARLVRAREIPDITVEVEVRARRWLAWRDRCSSEERPSITALLAAALARALHEHPVLNSTFEDDLVVRHDTVNLGIAVARPKGLIVPVLKGIETLTLTELTRQSRQLIDKARADRLTMDDVSGGTFTLSNLGDVGVDRFRALINPPQVAILAVGRIAERVVPINGAIGIEPTLQLSLTCDHRVVDGEPAGRFLVALKQFIEEPEWMGVR
jgi:pyruvate dehydrogenase E2 component (dihydrolipoamide acetyltransferase)